jgi:hypothetical protein
MDALQWPSSRSSTSRRCTGMPGSSVNAAVRFRLSVADHGSSMRGPGQFREGYQLWRRCSGPQKRQVSPWPQVSIASGQSIAVGQSKVLSTHVSAQVAQPVSGQVSPQVTSPGLSHRVMGQVSPTQVSPQVSPHPVGGQVPPHPVCGHVWHVSPHPVGGQVWHVSSPGQVPSQVASPGHVLQVGRPAVSQGSHREIGNVSFHSTSPARLALGTPMKRTSRSNSSKFWTAMALPPSARPDRSVDGTVRPRTPGRGYERDGPLVG